MEADVLAGLAHRARLPVRPRPSRPRPRDDPKRNTSPIWTALASRDDLNYLFEEMLGELTVGHMYVGGGDRPEVDDRSRAACSARTTRSRTAAIGSRTSTTARTGTRSCGAADQPGVNVKAGEYLLAVNGQRTHARPTTSIASSKGPPASRSCCGSARTRTAPAPAKSPSSRSSDEIPLAQSGLDRRQPPQGGRADRRPGRLRLSARHRTPAATRTSIATSSPRSTRRR